LTRPIELEQFIRTGSLAIIEAIGDAISIQDTSLRVIYQNQAHVRMMGEHLGEYCYSAYQGKDLPCPGCHLVESFQDGEIHRRETFTNRPGRGTVYVEVISTPLKDAAGKVIGGIESVRDITDRVLTEKKLSQQLMAIEASLDGIAILNEAGEYTYLNPAHAAIYGYTAPAELIGRSWQALYDDVELLRLQLEILPLLQREKRWRGEATGKKRDGTLFPQELSLSLTSDLGIVCVVRDISGRRAADKRLKELNRDLEQRARELQTVNRELETFSYTLSHDVGNYLSRIVLAADALRESYVEHLDETGHFLLTSIDEACDGLNNLIHAILHLAKANQQHLPHTPVDLSALALEVGNEQRALHPEQQVELEIHSGAVVNGDRNLLKVLLMNLLGNAWKYTSQLSVARVIFGLHTTGGETVFFVQDNGAGFDMQEADKLFKPFSRLGNASHFKGTGIGLATAQRIVQAHGGRIWATGSPGEGATFFFTLPGD